MDSRSKLDNPTSRGRLRGTRRTMLMDRSYNGHMNDLAVKPIRSSSHSTENSVKTTSHEIHDVKPSKHNKADIDSQFSQPTNFSNSPTSVQDINARSLKTYKLTTELSKKIVLESTSTVIKPRIDGLASKPKRVLMPRPDLPKQKKSNVLKRQMLKVPPYTVANKHRRPFVPTVLSGLAAVLFVGGIFVLINTLRTDHTVKAQVKQLTQKTENDNGISDGTPSEANPPSAAGNNNYQVSAELPRLLAIDKIDINARIRRVGVGPNNILNAPANIYDVGWYDGSAKPGENGTIVLDGHVSGPTKHGVFYSIGTLKSGDKVKIERGDGKQFTYSVTGTDLFDNDKVDMSKVMTTSLPGKPGLNLMTCAGRFNVRTNQFEQRIVVYTVQDE